MVRTGLGPCKLVSAMGSSCHPGLVSLVNNISRDMGTSSTKAGLMSYQGSSH